MLLYTVDRKNSLTPNTTLVLSKTDPLFLPYYNVEGLIEESDLQEHVNDIFPDGLSHHGWAYLKKRHTFGTSPHFNHITTLLTEMNYEYVRSAFYPLKPSRFKSVFACGSLESAELFKADFGKTDSKIFQLECEKFSIVDMNLLFLGAQNVAGSFLAHKYWKGQYSAHPFLEYIVELPAKVVREVA